MATPLLKSEIISDDKSALPTAITLFLNNTGVSADIWTFFPHHTTCLQNTDFPCSTKGAASEFISIQFSLNFLLFSKI